MPPSAKAACFLFVPTVLLALFGVPGRRAAGAPPDAWARFAAVDARYEAPEGLEASDPFAPSTPHLRLRWPLRWPARSVRIAHLGADDAAFQVFLQLGPRAELEPIVEEAQLRYEGDVLVRHEPETLWETSDGVTLRVRTLRHPPGVAGDDETLLLAWGAVDRDRWLVVDASGRTADFDRPAVHALVRSIRVER